MKAVFINSYGSAENLIYGDLPEPEPAKGELRISVKAASVNPVDWKVREGRLKFLSGKNFPMIMGTEAAGVVDALGPGVTGFSIGDRVYAGLSHKGGGYAEKVVTAQNKVVPIPDELSYEDASTLVVAGVTPYQALTLHANTSPGDRVLINGASGGVGTYAVQIAKVLGAHVTAVCSERNVDLVRSLGADEVIDYGKEDFRSREKAFDLILDAASNAFFPEVKKCLKPGGVLIKLNLSLRSLYLSVTTRLFSSRRLKMILVKNRKEDLDWMIGKMAQNQIKVVMERTFPLEKAKEAQLLSESGRSRGKIVLVVNEGSWL